MNYNNMLPETLIKYLEKQYSEKDYKRILSGYVGNKRVSFRINPLKKVIDNDYNNEILAELTTHNIKYCKSSFYQDAYYLVDDREESLMGLSCYEDGKIYVQNFSSMIPPLIFNYSNASTILDMTAAPGSKTSEIAALCNNKISITACERDKGRFERLKYNLQKLGVKNFIAINKDALDLDDFFIFDRILLDAPCCGSGTVNIINDMTSYRLTDKYLEKNTRTQLLLLKKAIKLLKKNEELIYSTCSILDLENENIIQKVLAEKNVQIDPIDEKWFQILPTLPTKIPGTLCVAPTDIYEGFFIAKLRKIK